jgi:drug/metabolite transporter (DMT)-like permease
MNAAPLHLLLPLGAAVIFSLSSICFKRAFAEGAGITRSFVINNLVLGTIFLPALLLDRRDVPWNQLWMPFVAGATFFAGHLANFTALRTGDVSLVAPLLGSKVIFVAIISAAFFGVPLRPEHWVAAVLTVVAVFTLGVPEVKGRHLARTTGLTLLSGLCFGLCDSLVQKWAGGFGVFNFLPLLFASVALQSCFLIPTFRQPLSAMSRATWKWVAIASVLTAMQAMIIGSTIGIFHDATSVNVIYSTRGLWGVLLVWYIGHHFGNEERRDVGHRMIWRVLGAVLMMVAVLLAIRGSSTQ